MHWFCTYFDHNYLPRALVLHESLGRYCKDFRLVMMCMDDAAYNRLLVMALPGVHLLKIEELESSDPELAATKIGRTKAEYCFTCTAAICRYFLRRFPDVKRFTYLDADLMFFDHPQPIFDEIEGYSVAIIRHRYLPENLHYEKFGKYNVGWITFCSDAVGRACIERWRAQCIEWCFDYVDGARFADQKYLDDWPQVFENVVEISHKGANLAPWNAGNYAIKYEGGRIWVDEQPLIFFHYAGFKEVSPGIFRTGFSPHGISPSKVTRARIFLPYIAALKHHRLHSGPPVTATSRTLGKPDSLLALKKTGKEAFRFASSVLLRDYVFDRAGRGGHQEQGKSQPPP